MNDLAYSVARALGGEKKTSTGWKCRCPVHNDHDPSLHIDLNKDGRLIFKCFSGCDQKAVFDTIKSRGLLPELPKQEKRIVAKYHYTDAEGTILFDKVRYEPKDFRVFHTDSTGQIKPGSNGHSKLLYQRHTLNDIKERQVVIVEGEKDCDYVIQHYGLICTSPPNGSGSWHSSFNPVFAGAHVVICPDNDQPGEKFAKQVANELSTIAASITIILLPSGKDISEWAGSKDDFLALIDGDMPKVSNADDLASNAKAPHYLIDGIIETDSMGMLAGASEAFKSFMALAMAHSICTGEDFMGHVTYGTNKVLYVCGEGKQALARRLKAIKMKHGGFADNLLIYDEKIFIDNDNDIAQLNRYVQKIKPALVVFDTFSSMNSQTNENDNSEVGSVLAKINRAISNNFTATMIVHHFGKDKDKGVRGASAFKNNVDFLFLMTRTGEREDMTASFAPGKTKDGQDFETINVIAKQVNLDLIAQNGSPVTSLILENEHKAFRLRGRPSQNVELFWRAFDYCIVDNPVQVNGEIGAFKKEVIAKFKEYSINDDSGRKMVYRVISDLIEDRKLNNISDILIKVKV